MRDLGGREGGREGEREALTLEFEAENEQLKGQVESLRTEVEGERQSD